MKIHRGEKQPGAPVENRQFPCETCGRVFAKLDNLQKHAKVHAVNETDSFRCTQCPFVFSTQWQVGKFCREL